MTAMWPWRRSTADVVEGVRAEVERARAEKLAAERRRAHAHELAVEAEEITDKLRAEIDLNGFTELLQKAMRSR